MAYSRRRSVTALRVDHQTESGFILVVCSRFFGDLDAAGGNRLLLDMNCMNKTIHLTKKIK